MKCRFSKVVLAVAYVEIRHSTTLGCGACTTFRDLWLAIFLRDCGEPSGPALRRAGGGVPPQSRLKGGGVGELSLTNTVVAESDEIHISTVKFSCIIVSFVWIHKFVGLALSSRRLARSAYNSSWTPGLFCVTILYCSWSSRVQRVEVSSREALVDLWINSLRESRAFHYSCAADLPKRAKGSSVFVIERIEYSAHDFEARKNS